MYTQTPPMQLSQVTIKAGLSSTMACTWQQLPAWHCAKTCVLSHEVYLTSHSSHITLTYIRVDDLIDHDIMCVCFELGQLLSSTTTTRAHIHTQTHKAT